MKYKHNKFIIFCSLCLVLWGVAAFAEGDSVLKVDAFGKLERPLCVFDHDAHNEKAQTEDCSLCHHVYDNGKKVEGESSEDKACSDCHDLKAQGKQPGLRTAYHQQCKQCHIDQKKGPVACGECHVKK